MEEQGGVIRDKDGVPVAEISTKQTFTRQSRPIKSQVSALDLVKTNTDKAQASVVKVETPSKQEGD